MSLSRSLPRITLQPTVVVCRLGENLASNGKGNYGIRARARIVCESRNLPKTEDALKRERILQVVLVIVGLIFSSLGYFLFQMLRHAGWMTGHNDVMPMFVSLYATLGVFLLLAVKHPAKHRSVIAYAAWSSLAHAATMTIMSLQAVAHGTHRQDSPQDIVMFAVIGAVLLALLPVRQASPAAMSKPQLAER